MKGKKGHKAKWLVLAAILLSGCSGDDSPNDANNYNGKDSEIHFNADVWRVMEGTRTTTYDNAAAIQEDRGGFTCTAYTANTTDYNLESNINACTVVWNGSKWEFGSHKWPNTDALDFFAYMPASPDAYITGPTYTTARQPQFTCDMTKTVNKEFIYALTLGQDKVHQGADGVTMTFRHPFARIYFQLSSSSGTAVKINSITISGDDFYKKAKCTFNGTTSTWSEKDDETKGSLGTLAINTPYIVIPNDYGSSKTITVNATWDEWSNFSTSVTSSPLTINWVPGYSYTYTFTLSKYALKVDVVDKYTEQW